MAVIVKGKPIKSTLQKAINYVADAYKTENSILVSAYGTSIDYGERHFLEIWNTNTNPQKKVLARHFKQSFAPGEVSPDYLHINLGQYGTDCQQGNREHQTVLDGFLVKLEPVCQGEPCASVCGIGGRDGTCDNTDHGDYCADRP